MEGRIVAKMKVERGRSTGEAQVSDAPVFMETARTHALRASRELDILSEVFALLWR